MLQALLALALIGGSRAVSETKPVVVVTGATGRTGTLLYKRLKAENQWTVRAFVRNGTKAKTALGCVRCDESEGIFEGDLTKPETLGKVMEGASFLAICTSSSPKCGPLGPLSGCSYPKGGEPKVVDFLGTKRQIEAFAKSSGQLSSKQILYVSTMDTTQPDNFLDRIDHGYVSFYHLQAEMAIMASGVPFTILKACGLSDGKGGNRHLRVGHDDDIFSYTHVLARDDIARVFVEAIRDPSASRGLRFDMCADWFGKPTSDIKKEIFDAARYAWMPKATGAATPLLV
eukprot:TRINITY_DN7440_c0_g6_i1.p1 TRINITY_DN7440_c0_g6~~TRINITY_DN7440_c0_g6_i1.p1  ORF type:complete len:287 (+),score=39.99 TRINITY_DN7440_c0_g6_i1:64-924(+)